MRGMALLALFVGFSTAFLAPAPAQAQATRTWVSGVGDDANPCSRTAPCKTFAGAISKTAASGEINCLDPGGFGAVTITKAITLNCSETIGSVLVAGTNGITISAGAGDRVVLRHIQLQGLGPAGTPGLVGIQINSGLAVSIEGCVVTQFSLQGIKDSRTAGGTRLFITDTTLSFNTDAGISVAATAANNAVLENVHSINNGFGVAVAVNNSVIVSRSVMSGSSTSGVTADTGAQLNINDSVISNNVTGVAANGTIRLSNSDISFNGTGISGTATSYGNNRISGNTSPGTTPTPASPGQQ